MFSMFIQAVFGARNLGALFIVLAGFVWTSSAVSGQTIIYVNAGAAPGGNGQSWGTAYNNLQSALTAATLLAAGGGTVEVWVAAGRYVPSAERIVGNPRSATFRLSSRVSLLGGFVGTELASIQRNPISAITILSGDRLNDDGPVFANTSDNCYRVLTAIGTDITAVVDGFRISGGNATSGAIGNTNVDEGGGLYLFANSRVTVRRCTFIGNRATIGGGIAADASSPLPDTSVLNVQGCSFFGNHAVSHGGAVYTANLDGDISNCFLSGNSAGIHGGGISGGSSTSIRNCTIVRNSAGSQGGAASGGLSLYNCIISSNGAPTHPGTSAGFGLLRVANCLFDQSSQYNVGTDLSDSIFTGAWLIDVDGPDEVAGTLDDSPMIASNSRAIDSGNNFYIYLGSYNYQDVLGGRRIADGNGDQIAVLDRGAVEYAALRYSPRIHVRAGAAGPQDGATWDTAYSSLQAAINVAQPDAGVEEIWIARATYKPAGVGGSRAVTFQLPINLAIYGGFIGTEATLNQRLPLPTNTADSLDPTKATILSGDLNGDDTGELNRADNSYHVVTASAVGSTATLDGFTITAGSASGTAPDHAGGGLLITAGSPTIRNITFNLNQAAVGGGAAITGVSSPTFSSCRFQSNRATGGPSPAGGAVRIATTAPSTPRFFDCVFESNRSDAAEGGAVGLSTSGSPIAPAFVRCSFIRNRAATRGAAASLAFSGGGDQASSPAGFTNCGFYGNVGEGGSTAVVVDSASGFDILNCEFVGNGFGDSGTTSAVSFEGSVAGGRGYRFINSTVVANGAAFPGTTAVRKSGSTPMQIANAIFWNNFSGALTTQNEQLTPGNAIPAYNTIEGWTGSFGGAGGNGIDPDFTRLPSPGTDLLWGTLDDDYGDLRPRFSSPVIDAGDSATLPLDAYDLDGDGNTSELAPLDLAGFPRFIDDPAASNTGPGLPPHVDRGAYESQVNCVTCPGPREWRSAVGGDWDAAINWTPSVPDASHDTVFDVDATFNVACAPPPSGLSSRSIQSLTVSDGSITFDLNQTTLNLTATQYPSLVVGTTSADGAALTITDGTLSAVNARIASVPTNGGVSPVTNTLNIGAGGTLIAARTLTIGAEGNGRMNITSGGRVVSRDATIGDQPGSNGFVSVSGSGGGVGGGPSTWNIPFFCIIDNGELNVSNQGVVNVGTGIPFTGIFLLNDGRISGSGGSINGNIVNFGRLSPGAAIQSGNALNGPGALTITGGYAQVGEIQDLGAFSGQLDIELGGTSAAQFDRLIITGGGEVTLGGGMTVRFAGNFVPSPTDNFRILDAGTSPIFNQFDVIFFPALTGPSVGGKFLRAGYSGLRGPGGGAGITLSLVDLPVNAGFNPPQPTTIASPPAGAAIGDLDQDGDLDLAVCLPGAGTAPGNLALLFNNGTGGFVTTQIPSGGVDPRVVAIGDFDGVQGNDLAIAHRAGATSPFVRILRQGSTQGTFGTPIDVPLPAGSSPVSILSVDLNPLPGGARPDLVVASTVGSDAGVLTTIENAPAPTPGTLYIPRTTPMPPQTVPTSITPDDLDGDKDPDLCLAGRRADGSGVVTVIANSSIFLPPFNVPAPPLQMAQISTGPDPIEIAAGVLAPQGASGPNANEFQDIVTINRAGQSVSVLRNTRSFSQSNPASALGLAPAVDYQIGADGRSLSLADLDNDGDLDIGALTDAASGRAIKVFRNDSQVINPTASQVAFAYDPSFDLNPPAGACPERLLSGDVTGDGRRDLVTVNTACTGGGSFGPRGPGTTLGSVSVNRNNLAPLSLSVGACCAPEVLGGGCTIVTIGECVNSGGSFLGAQVSCASGPGGANPCPQPPAVCCRGSTCAILSSTACAAAGPNTAYQGPSTTCNAPNNRTTPCCLADFNQSGVVTVQDIFSFLEAYFGGSGFADINRNGGTSVQDIFEFLAAYFIGCA